MHGPPILYAGLIVFFVALLGSTALAAGPCDDQNVPTCGACTSGGCVGPGGFAYPYCRVIGSDFIGNLTHLETVFFCSDFASVNCGFQGMQGLFKSDGTKNGITIKNCNIRQNWSSIQTIQVNGANTKLLSNNFIDDGTNLFDTVMNANQGLVVSGNHFSLLSRLTTSSNNVTFSGNTRPNDPILNPPFLFTGSNNVISENSGSYRFEIKGTASNPSLNNTFSGNDFNQATVLFSYSSGNQITDNTFASPWSENALTMNNSSNNTVTNNIFVGPYPFSKFDTTSTDIGFNTFVGGGMMVDGSFNTIHDNVISNKGNSSVMLGSSSNNNTLTKNVICTAAGYVGGVGISNSGVSNTGSNNKCEITTNWSDSGMTNGCAFSCFTPVVLVHGYYGDPVGTWTTTKNFLQSKGFKVYAVDLDPGIPPANGNIKGYANVLKAFIDDVKEAEGVNKVDIVAHSMGGLVSRWYIQGKDYGGDVRTLIMEGTPNHGTPLGNVPFLLPMIYPVSFFGVGTAGYQMLPHSWVINELNTGDPLYYSDFFPDVISPTVKYYTITGTQGFTTFPQSLSSLFLPGSDDGVVPAGSVPLSGVPNFTYSLNHTNLHENTAVLNKVYDLLISSNSPAGLPSEAAGSFSVLDSFTTSLNSGQTFTDTMVVDQITPHMVVPLFPPDTVSDFNLVSPTGKVYTPTSLDANTTIEQNAATGIKAYSVKTPVKGVWSVKIKASPTSGAIQASVWTLTQNVLTLKLAHFTTIGPNQPLVLTAKITNGVPVVTGATVVATFTSPASSVSSIPLLDDGTHNDGSANDGTYGGTFTNTSGVGAYSIQVDANGTANGGFQRVAHSVFEVGDSIDVEIVSAKTKSPVLLNSPTVLTAQIRNNGNVPATNIMIKAKEGKIGEDVNAIGETTVTVSPNQTVPVTFNWTPHAAIDYNVSVFVSSFNDSIDFNSSNNSITIGVKVINCTKPLGTGGIVVGKCIVNK